MLARILILVIIFGVCYLIGRFILSKLNKNLCQHCNGEGHWKGTRGEKNGCKICDGSGKKNS